MAITREEIKGTKIICEVKSSNFKKAEYDVEDKTFGFAVNVVFG